MSNFVNTIETLGDRIVAESLITRSITDFDDDLIVTLGDSVFRGCSKLTSINLPNVTSAESNAFYNCSQLTSVNLPNVTSLGQYVFYNCKAITSLTLPKLTSFRYYAFQYCSGLTRLDLPKLTSLVGNGVAYCSVLTTLILRSPTVCTLANTNAFNNTPFAAGNAGGTVYVPQALIESYQTATNWSTLYAAGTCNFVAIEGSEYE